MTPLGDPRQAEVFYIIVGGVMLAAIAGEALSAPVGVWTGPGDRACAGRCDEAWSRNLLPEHRRVDLERAGEPVETVIRDGEFVSLMTYYDNGPVAQTGVVAMLDRPEPATCRVMDGWSWCLIHGCKNWAAVEHAAVAPVKLAAPVAPIADNFSTIEPSAFIALAGGAGGGGFATTYRPSVSTQPVGVAPVSPAPVPLPASGLLLLAGLALVWRARR